MALRRSSLSERDGEPFSLNALSLLGFGDSTGDLDFVGTLAAGGTVNETVSYSVIGAGGRTHFLSNMQNVTSVAYMQPNNFVIDAMFLDPLSAEMSPAIIDGTQAIAGSSQFTENRMTLTASGSLAAANHYGPAAGVGSDGETLTLTASDGNGFVLYGLDLISTSGTSQTITFTPTTLNGTTLDPIEVDLAANSKTSESFTDLNSVLGSLSWNMPANVWIDKVSAASRVEAVVNFESLESNVSSYNEYGYVFSGGNMYPRSERLVPPRDLLIVAEDGGSFSF